MRSRAALVLPALFLAACGSAAGVTKPPTHAEPATSTTQPSPWCVPISREKVISSVMRMFDYATSGDTAEAKLVNGPELHTLTPNVTTYHGEFDPSSLYWAVEVRRPDGKATIHAGMDDGSYAWAVYIFNARTDNGAGNGVQAGPGTKSPGFDALTDHSNECTS